MQKNVSKEEKQLVLEWLQDNITIAEMARKLDIDPRTTKPYVRITKTVKQLYMDRAIIVLKQ